MDVPDWKTFHLGKARGYAEFNSPHRSEGVTVLTPNALQFTQVIRILPQKNGELGSCSYFRSQRGGI